MKSITQPTKVCERGMTALIQRLGLDCSPTQFLREYVKNGIEAVQRSGKTGRVVVDFNEDILNDEGVYKISFADSGDGMSCATMREKLNQLSSSGDTPNEHENYGMGAKISALTRNHAGILYESVSDAQASSVLIGYDDDTGVYGIIPDDEVPGAEAWCPPIEVDSLPDLMRDGGTRVTLLGMENADDTMAPPKSMKGGRGTWACQYINSRFFTIPNNIDVSVRVYYHVNASRDKNCVLRSVKGQKHSLDSHTVNSGTVSLTDAKVHWWILEPGRDGKSREYITAHSGLVNQGETFELSDGTASRCPGFGISFGKENVVIYIEPSPSRYRQDTTRSRIVSVSEGELPWQRWQTEFRSLMPQQLKDYMSDYASKSAKTSHADTIRERLKSVSKFFQISAFVKSKTGSAVANENDYDGDAGISRKGEPNPDPDPNPDTPVNPSVANDSGSGTKKRLRSRARKNGIKAREINPDNFPPVHWLTIAEGTRSIDDDLEDRAARFLQHDNMIQANGDFQGFQDIINHFAAMYQDHDQAHEVIVSCVRESFEQVLTEVVVGVLSLQDRPLWGPDKVEEVLSNESLTAATMTRFHTLQQINRSIRSKLGKPTEQAA